MSLHFCRRNVFKKRLQTQARKVRNKRFRLSLERLESRVVFHIGDHAGDISVLPGFYLDPALENVEPSPPGPDTGPTPSGTPSYSTLSNGMPVLNSLISAPTSIYLDFDGDLSGSNPYGDHTVSPYSEDTDATTFNVSEQRNIYEAWREISSYFAIFDTNVTTVVPAGTQPRAWLAVGNNISGGYSYVGVFPNNTAPKSWNNSGDARTRVSGIAHELGHNFGLSHQATYDQWGNLTAEYASATDSLHGPIMGVDYSGIVHKFIMGHNSSSTGVTTLQDDIAVIASKIKTYQAAGGDGFRVDDFGNTIATATALPVSGSAQWTSAIIERMTDVDAFSFTSLGGAYALSAAPDTPSGVDLKLDIYAADGTLIASNDGLNNVQQLTMNLPAGTYYALVSSHGNYGDLGRYFMSVSPLPAGWASSDIGTGVSGYTVYDSSTGAFNPVGSGSGITGSADSFQYAYQILNGDGTITARVANVDNTSANAVVGVSIRETLAANSRQIAVAYTTSGITKTFTRATVGGSVSSTSNTVAGNRWVRLTRVGNTFTSAYSSDGVTWTNQTSTTVTMSSTVTIGLLTASNNNHAMNVGQLDSVAVTGNLGPASPSYNSLPAPSGLTPALGTGSGLNLTWDSVAGATGYAVDRSTDGVNYTQIGTTTSTSYTDPNLTGSMRYFYRVSASDASGRSVPSGGTSIINRPSAVTNLSITTPNATTLVLNWRETTGETGYRIERSTDSGATFSLLATVGANVPSYTNSGLTSGTVYQYRIIPTSNLGDGVTSTIVSGAPRLAAVSPTLGTVATGSLTINWADLTNETNYRIERSTDGTTYSTLATAAANAVTYTDTAVVAGTEYYYRIYGTTALTQSLNGTSVFAAAPSTTPPAAPWSSADIGTVSGPGTTSFASGTYTLVSSGSDVTSTADSFRFTSQPTQGDAEIIARVATLENTGGSAKVGVMIRQSNAANAANAFVYATPSVIGFSYRGSAGGTTTVVSTATGTAPQWVKLTRSGNNFIAAYSTDGTTWTQLGTPASITMSGVVATGIAATSNSTTKLNTSTLTNVSISSAGGVLVSAPTPSSSTSEAGGTTSFSVSLTKAPTTNVVIPVSSSDTTEGVVSTSQLTFTAANWNTPQTVTITGVNDNLDDGDIPYSIVLGAVGSSDLSYSNLDPADVSLTNVDDDAVGFTVSAASPSTTSEAGTTSAFSVRLNSEPTANVTINVSSSDTTEGTVSTGTLTFTPTDWNVAQTVTVTGVNDNVADGNVAYAIVLAPATSTDGGYNGLNPNDINLSNLDDDTAGITVSAASSPTTSEAGGTSTFSVKLNSEPTANVTINISSSDTTEGTASVSSLTFSPSNWNVPQSVIATGANDSIADGNVAYSIVLAAASSADVVYNGMNPSDVNLTNLDDNDAVGVTVSAASSLTTSEAGGTSTFTVQLNSEPTANVTIGISSTDTTEGTVSPSSLTFTPANWNVPQTVTVTGVNDDIADGNIGYTVVTANAISTDGGYNDFSPSDISLTNTDNDVAGISVSSPTGTTTSETGAQITFTVRLNSQPTANVTLPIISNDLTEGTVSPDSLTFTSANWNIAQTVTVLGVNDNLDDGDIAYAIVLGPSSSFDSAYNGLNPSDINLTNQDNDTAGVAVSAASSTATTEAGGTVTFTVQLTTQPGADVSIPVSSNDATEGSVNTGSLVFTSANWNLPQTVTVTGVNDNVDDGDIAYSVVLGAAASQDSLYQAFNAADVGLVNRDDDTFGFTISSLSGSSTSEVGGSVTFTVRLNSEPTANVTLPVSSSDTTEGTVSAASLVFTAANWNTTQTVTVTGVDDTILDGNVGYQITLGPATSGDALYNGHNPADFTLTNTDNEVAPSTKFYVVNDGSPDRTYEYSATGASVETYAINSGNTAPRGIATTAVGDKVWVVDSNRKVYVYNNSGGLLGSWTAGTLATNATVEGVATDGTNIWIVDARADRIYYYANAASLITGTQNATTSFALASGNTSPKDLVFGTTSGLNYLWVVNDASVDRVYRYTLNSSGLSTGSTNWAINTANKAPTGIALDPSNASQDLWIVDSGTDSVYRYTNGRTATTASPTSSVAYVLAAGNTNPQGIADPPPFDANLVASGGLTSSSLPQASAGSRLVTGSTLTQPALAPAVASPWVTNAIQIRTASELGNQVSWSSVGTTGTQLTTPTSSAAASRASVGVTPATSVGGAASGSINTVRPAAERSKLAYAAACDAVFADLSDTL